MSKESRKPRSKSDTHWDLGGPCDKDIQGNSPSGQSLTIPESALRLLGSPSWNLLVDRVHDKAQPPRKGAWQELGYWASSRCVSGLGTSSTGQLGLRESN